MGTVRRATHPSSALALRAQLFEDVFRVRHPASGFLDGLSTGISLTILALVHDLPLNFGRVKQLFHRVLVPRRRIRRMLVKKQSSFLHCSEYNSQTNSRCLRAAFNSVHPGIPCIVRKPEGVLSINGVPAIMARSPAPGQFFLVQNAQAIVQHSINFAAIRKHFVESLSQTSTDDIQWSS